MSAGLGTAIHTCKPRYCDPIRLPYLAQLSTIAWGDRHKYTKQIPKPNFTEIDGSTPVFYDIYNPKQQGSGLLIDSSKTPVPLSAVWGQQGGSVVTPSSTSGTGVPSSVDIRCKYGASPILAGAG